MSLHEYKVGQEISAQDPPFYALIMACFRKADTDNLEKLRRAFPFRFQEYLLRLRSPGGLLEGEQFSRPQKFADTPLVLVGAGHESSEEDPDGT